MNAERVERFIVMGREARTSNSLEMSGKGVIGAMWAKGTPPGWPLVAVYSEYASDKDGEYNYLLGRKSFEDETLPRDLTHRTVSSGSYVRLSFAGSISPEAVVGLWQQIWEAEQQGKIRRAYKTDFELYNEGGFDLYVGVL